jgi:hypothetical protein
MHDLDEWMQSQLILASLKITTAILQKGGTFVAKIFVSYNVDLLKEQMLAFFKQVFVVKPPSSRASSMEHFIVCKSFFLPDGFSAELLDIYLHGTSPSLYAATFSCHPALLKLLPFVALGSFEALILES